MKTPESDLPPPSTPVTGSDRMSSSYQRVVSSGMMVLDSGKKVSDKVIDSGKKVIDRASQQVIESSYLSDKNLISITEHKFLSGEYTYLDQVFYQLWWIPCLKIVPQWMAPNTLTVLGFIFSITAFCLIYSDAPTLTEPITGTKAIQAAICIFLYQTLDALDGLHARKYGYGSPLGQLMDHGCDAFTTGFFAHIQLSILRLGTGDLKGYVILSFFQSSLFIYSWWEKTFHEYRTNSANRGVTEGQVLLIIQLTAISWYGHELWNVPMRDLPFSLLHESLFNVLENAYQSLAHYTDKYTSVLYEIAPDAFELGAFYFNYSLDCRFGAVILITNIYLQGEMIVIDLVDSVIKSIEEEKTASLLEYITYAIHLISCFAVFYSDIPGKVYPFVCHMNGSLMGGILTIRLILSTVGKRKFSILQWPQVPVLLGCGSISFLTWYSGPTHWFVLGYGPAVLHSVLAFQLITALHLIIVSVVLLRKHLRVRVFHVQSKDQ